VALLPGGIPLARSRDAHVNAANDLPRAVVAADDTELRQLLVRRLQRDGFQVEAVADGADLRERVRAWFSEGEPRPDILVSDMHMRGGTGLDALIALRAKGSRMPVVLITAFGEEELHRRVRELCNALVLDKPFEMEDLRAAVRTLLAEHR
jgi:DNA-binding response OmpR family regulator